MPSSFALLQSMTLILSFSEYSKFPQPSRQASRLKEVIDKLIIFIAKPQIVYFYSSGPFKVYSIKLAY